MEFKLKRKIAEGSDGEVYEGIMNGKTYAFKKFHFDDEDIKEENSAEIMIQIKLRHPNILKLTKVLCLPEGRILVFPLCRMTLRDYYINEKNEISVEEILNHMHQLASAVEYLHEEKIVHCDIKPINILLDNNEVKLIDFSAALKLENNSINHPFYQTIGTEGFRAPELCSSFAIFYNKGNLVSFPIDVWAYGVVFYKLLIRDDFDDLFKLSDLDSVADKLILRGFSFNGIKLVLKCLRENPIERITFKQILNHVAFKSIKK